MTQSYDTTSTSTKTATINDIWLNEPEDKDAYLTRRILRAEIVDNIHSVEARVKASIIHQRRHSKSADWKDTNSFNRATLKAGEEVNIQLDSAETHSLFGELKNLYAISDKGIPQGNQKLVVSNEESAIIVQGREKDVIQQLLQENGSNFWHLLSELQPDLLRVVALTKLHEMRANSVEIFEQHLNMNDWIEGDWQRFFQENTWIFGYGLSYHFLSTIDSQPYFGGMSVTGRDGQRGDFLTNTEAQAIRFTVIVEIKRPDTILVNEKLHRNGVHLISNELIGGTSQVQSNCRTWEMHGSRNERDKEKFDKENIYTVQPKGILVVGNTNQIDTIDKRTTFELFRRNLQNPEIITFDELLERARHLLLNEGISLAQGDTTDEVDTTGL